MAHQQKKSMLITTLLLQLRLTQLARSFSNAAPRVQTLLQAQQSEKRCRPHPPHQTLKSPKSGTVQETLRKCVGRAAAASAKAGSCVRSTQIA